MFRARWALLLPRTPPLWACGRRWLINNWLGACVRVRACQTSRTPLLFNPTSGAAASLAQSSPSAPHRPWARTGAGPNTFFGNAVPGMQPAESKVLLERPTVAGLESSDEREKTNG